MKRIETLAHNLAPNFIGSWQIEALELCDEIIDFFESNPEKHTAGKVSSGAGIGKKSTDLSVKPSQLKEEKFQLFDSYIKQLYSCYKDYTKQWPFFERYKNLEISSFNVQRYENGDHFSKTHTERDAIHIYRLFAWMTYLNDVEDGGETIFPHYQVAVKPQKGKTLIWPAEWTHAHFGEIVNQGPKYIITGWINFPPDKDGL